MAERQKIRCPRCGAEMNFHAEKVDYSRTPGDPAEVGAVFDGVLVEFHTCPECGQAEERTAL